jgi:hypothetical protein
MADTAALTPSSPTPFMPCATLSSTPVVVSLEAVHSRVDLKPRLEQADGGSESRMELSKMSILLQLNQLGSLV